MEKVEGRKRPASKPCEGVVSRAKDPDYGEIGECKDSEAIADVAGHLDHRQGTTAFLISIKGRNGKRLSLGCEVLPDISSERVVAGKQKGEVDDDVQNYHQSLHSCRDRAFKECVGTSIAE